MYVVYDVQVVGREGMSFVEYQSNMVILAKSILMTIDKMIGMIGTRVNSSDLDRLASQLTREYDMFASNSANAAATSNSKDVSLMLILDLKKITCFLSSESFFHKIRRAILLYPPHTRFGGYIVILMSVRSSVRPSQSLIRYSSKTAEQNFMKLSEIVHYMMPYCTSYFKFLFE